MKEKKQWLIRLFIILFFVSISVAVLPCGIINTHGLFGEITSSTITNDDDNSSFQESRVFENRKQIKGINIYNIWFEVLICVICMIYIQYMFRLPREDTIITFKVRMDNWFFLQIYKAERRIKLVWTRLCYETYKGNGESYTKAVILNWYRFTISRIIGRCKGTSDAGRATRYGR